MVMIGWVMTLAPYGVFALSAAVFGNFGVELLGSLFMFCVTVAIGELVHGLGVMGVIVRVFVGMNPVTFFRKTAKAPLVAFSTSSSNAAPVSITVAESDWISKRPRVCVAAQRDAEQVRSALYKLSRYFIGQFYASRSAPRRSGHRPRRDGLGDFRRRRSRERNG